MRCKQELNVLNATELSTKALVFLRGISVRTSNYQLICFCLVYALFISISCDNGYFVCGKIHVPC